MTLYSLLDQLGTRGVTLTVDQDQLRYRAPRGALDDDLRAALSRFHDQIINLLSDPAPQWPAGPLWARLLQMAAAKGDLDMIQRLQVLRRHTCPLVRIPGVGFILDHQCGDEWCRMLVTYAVEVGEWPRALDLLAELAAERGVRQATTPLALGAH